MVRRKANEEDLEDSIVYVPRDNKNLPEEERFFSVQFLEEMEVEDEYEITDKNGQIKLTNQYIFSCKIFDMIKGLNWVEKEMSFLSSQVAREIQKYKPLKDKRFRICITKIDEYNYRVKSIEIKTSKSSQKSKTTVNKKE